MEKKQFPSSRNHYRHPSFSSTLLDQIYRSIDEDTPVLDSTRKKKKNYHNQETSHVYHHTTTVATTDSVLLRYSNSSSSDSSTFSSSESDSFYKRSRQPKPIRTSVVEKPNNKQELGGFLRTKTKALKIYTDLKKMKQPISPGGRLASFLNSLFTTNASNNPKKPKKTSVISSSTTCSSASSFSRSCLSKTPSSSGKSKRSVRFCPDNVILDEDSSIHVPCRYSNRLYGNNDVMEENRRVIEAAKDLLRTYHKNKEHEDEDDVASCASSDLFELENLSAIGIERYQKELPVYETTRLDKTNRSHCYLV